jgi:ComF family protein
MTGISRYSRDFFNLFYPDLCAACSRTLNSGEKHICSTCLWRMPKTNFHLQDDNPVIRKFWGKVNVEAAASFVFFDKGERMQHILHSLKYAGNRAIGIFLGELYGNQLRQAPLFAGCEAIIPVPLHRKKIKMRGYNQSSMIAEGLSKTMGIPHYTEFLERTVASSTQTKKSRYARFENVENVFRLNGQKVNEKHFLLVDDVITTGSTLESCARCLAESGEVKISVATIACVM